MIIILLYANPIKKVSGGRVFRHCTAGRGKRVIINSVYSPIVWLMFMTGKHGGDIARVDKGFVHFVPIVAVAAALLASASV